MALWYSVYHKEDYEAEIQVGLHGQWLRQLEFGPTQADRVLVHTDMMEHAHERRFAVCEAHMDLSYFEAEHSHRIQHAIDHLQAHFIANSSREADDSDNHQDDALIGLARCPSEGEHHDCSQFATHRTSHDQHAVQSALHSMLRRTKATKRPWESEVVEGQCMVDTSESEDDDAQHRMFTEVLNKTRKRTCRDASEGPRLLKPVRYRRHLVRSNVKEHKRPGGVARSQPG